MSIILIQYSVKCPYSKILCIPPWKLPSVKYCNCLVSFKKDSSDDVVRHHFLNHLESDDSSVFVFADGSRSNAGVGSEIVFPDFNYCGVLPANASVFTSELYNILTTLKRIVHYENNSNTIFSDSKSVLEDFGSFNPVYPLILEIL